LGIKIGVDGGFMKVIKITYPTNLLEIRNIDDDNIDVFVQLEDGNVYTLVVSTPKNIMTLIKKNNKCFLGAGPPMIIVSELTEKCIKKAIESFSAGEAYWLKEYYLSGNFSIETLNKMIVESKE
jgi:hypothetical protein